MVSGDVGEVGTLFVGEASNNSQIASANAMVADGGPLKKNSSGSINSTSVTKNSSSCSPKRRCYLYQRRMQ